MRLRENLKQVLRWLLWDSKGNPKFDLWDAMYFGGLVIAFFGLRGIHGTNMAQLIIGFFLAITAVIGAGLLRGRPK